MLAKTSLHLDNVSIVFGDSPAKALPLMDDGLDRNTIRQQTEQVLGVHNCNLKASKGSIVVLMGLSGSGKSTLLRAINGLNEVTRGAININTDPGNDAEMIDVTKADAATLRKLRLNNISMVFQSFALLPWRTVADNVGFPLELGGVKRSKRYELVRKQLAMVGLEDDINRNVSELSGGMQQRVGLARALVTDADILLMDEPFSALDPLIRSKLQDDLIKLQHKLQKTIIFVSHDLSEALKLGSHIAIMDGGRIVQQGGPQDIILNPANDYVAEFVAHVNPLSVLRACDVMTLLNEQTEFTMGDKGNIKSGAKDINTVPADDNIANLPVGAIAVTSLETRLDDLIRMRQQTGMPVAISEGSLIVGIVDDDAIYKGIIDIEDSR